MLSAFVSVPTPAARRARWAIYLSMAVLLSGAVFGCSTIGTGDSTVIRATTDNTDLIAKFPFLLTGSNARSARTLLVDGPNPANLGVGRSLFPTSSSDSRAARYTGFDIYMGEKYGDANYDSASLSITVRDLGRIPPLSPDFTAVLRQEILKIQANTSLTTEAKQARIQEISAVILNAPELSYSTTLDRIDASGHEIYHYFPHLQIDFTADLLSNSALDRFSQLVMYIRLSDKDRAKGIRFVDFSPKGSDIAEYSRGQFKQNAQAQAKATAGRTGALATTEVSGDTTTAANRGFSLGAELAYTGSEEFTRQLADALERQTVGIVENGQALLAQFRAIRQLRIGGTYEFDVMLEIPSIPRPTSVLEYYELEPVARQIKPEIALIGVVRHVYERGLTGFFYRVPETENDHVYQQVVLKQPSVLLWSFYGQPWIRPYVMEEGREYSVHVVTGHEQANFVILDESNGRVLGFGAGAEKVFKIATDALAGDVTASIRFKPIVVIAANGDKVTFDPDPPVVTFQIPQEGTGGVGIDVTYR